MPALENEISETSFNYLQNVDKRASDAASLSYQEMLDADPFVEAEKEKAEPQRLDEVQAGAFRDNPLTQAIAGSIDAFRETLNLPTDIAGIIKGEELKGIGEFVPEIPKSEGVANNLIRSTSQFLTDFAPIQAGLGKVKFFAKGAKATKIAQTEIAGALAGAAAFDPDEPRLSNLINDLLPALKNPVTDFLATDPDDTAAEGRFKNALEGLGLGALTEGVFSAFRGIRAAKGLFKKAKAVEGAATDVDKLIRGVEATEEIGTKEEFLKRNMNEIRGGFAIDEIKAVTRGDKPAHYKAVEDKDAIAFAKKQKELKVVENITKSGDYIVVQNTVEGSKLAKELTALSKRREKIFASKDEELIREWNDEFSRLLGRSEELIASQTGISGFGDLELEAEQIRQFKLQEQAALKGKIKTEDIPTLNLTGQETMDEFLGKVAKQDDFIGKRFKAKRGKRSNFTSKQAADFVEIDKEFVKNLPEGTALNAESTIKVARVVADTLKEMEILAKRVMDGTATDEERVLLSSLRKDVGLLDPKFFGVRGEAGRTLQIFNVLSPIVDRLKGLTESAESLSREGITDEQFASMFLTIMKEADPKTTAKWLRIARRVPGMITEVWLSMLLTGIKTHVVNFTGNMSTLFLAPIERGVAAHFPGSSIARGESTAMLYGMTMAFTDALRLAGRTLKTGIADDTLLRAASKAEGFQRKLTAEAFELEKSGIAGRAVDMAGSLLTSPLRLLLASDVMFKHVNKVAQIHALAIREAAERGLTGQKAGAFISDFVSNPDQRTVKAAGDFASYQTFTNDVGKLGTAIQDFANAHMLAKMFLPFVRTPINIFKYSFERTPLAAAAKAIKLTLSGTNNVEKDLAIARLALSSMATATIASMVMAGRVTGSGPTNPIMRKQMEALGWKKNSFLIGGYHDGEKVVGGTYVSYSRFDPIGMGIGVVADFVESGNTLLDYSQTEEMALGIVISFSRNMLSKTYVTGMQHAMDLLTVGVTGGDLGLSFAQAKQAGKSVQLSFIPTIVKDYKKAIDPVLRVQNTWWEGVKANMPYFSEDLFPERNIFGDVVVRNVGVFSMANPLYISYQKNDMAMEELVKRDVKISPIPRWIAGKKPRFLGKDDIGQGFFLTNEQHDFWKVETGIGLRQAIIKLMSSSEYRFKTSDVEKQKQLIGTVRLFKDKAYELMKDRFELQSRVDQKRFEFENAQSVISELIGE